MKLIRRLTKPEWLAWRKIRKQLQREGLEALEANVATTGWTFAKHANTGGRVHQFPVDPAQGRDSLDGPGSGLDASVQASVMAFGSSSIGLHPTALAVDRLRDAVRALPARYPYRRYLEEWSQSGPHEGLNKRHGITDDHKQSRILAKFLKRAGLGNPWYQPRRSPGEMRAIAAESKHGQPRKLTPREIAKLNLSPPLRDGVTREDWLKQHKLKLSDLERNG